MEKIDKQKAVLVASGLLIVALLGWYLFSLGQDVQHNRERTDAVAGQLKQTGTELQNTAAGLKHVEQTIGRSVGTVNRVETVVREVQVRTQHDAAVINESAKLINDSQRIVSAVRARGADKTSETAP